MMKTKYGIGLFIFSFIMIYLSWNYFYPLSDTPVNTDTNTVVSADGQAVKENCYFLYEINGYVVIYQSDKKTIYEYTDIRCEELPKLLQKEIKNGKYISNVEELYGFLENYTS